MPMSPVNDEEPDFDTFMDRTGWSYLSMKINQPQQSIGQITQNIQELEQIISQLTQAKIRPCENCTQRCSCSQSLTCICDCSADCPLAASLLSSDKDRYPIEENVLSLVYSLNEMHVCQPCWSCEGHNNDEGKVNKIPQVWFYTNSHVLIRMIDQCLSFFKQQRLISYTWNLTSTYSSKDCAHNAFSLKPDLNLEASPNLNQMQLDMKVIANNISTKLYAVCDDYLQEQVRLLQKIGADESNLGQIK